MLNTHCIKTNVKFHLPRDCVSSILAI